MLGRLACSGLRRTRWFFAIAVIATLPLPGCGDTPTVDTTIKAEPGKSREESIRPGLPKKAGAADPRFGKGPD